MLLQLKLYKVQNNCRLLPQKNAHVARKRVACRVYDPSSEDHKKRLLKHLSKGAPSSGSERGEAFLAGNPGGEIYSLDVDAINEKMRYTGAARLRNVQAPDQAYGLIFNLDNVVANTREAMAHAWAQVARDRALPCPPDTMRLVQYGSCPERIMIDVLGWCRELKHARELCWDLSEHYGTALMQQTEPSAPGLREWLDSASSYSMPCAAVSTLDRAAARRLLERMHLHDHFEVLITVESEVETQAQGFLSSALQLRRPPNHCVVFDDAPAAINAAHNASMKAVGLISKVHPAWRLRGADLTCTSLKDLTIYNVRRLFANSGLEYGDLVTQASDDDTPRKRRITNATF